MITIESTETIAALARKVRADWKNVSPYAAPYLAAMEEMHFVEPRGQRYYQDSADSVVLYFLSNASGWRGEIAKTVKAELKRRAV